jgi:hypothetical protein
MKISKAVGNEKGEWVSNVADLESYLVRRGVRVVQRRLRW